MTTTALGCEIAGVTLPSGLLSEPEAGPRTEAEARAAAASALGAVVTPPLVADSPAERPATVRSGSSVLAPPGAADIGLADYRPILKALGAAQKPVIATVTGTSLADFERGLADLADAPVALIQLDLSRRTASSSRYLSDKRVLGLRHEFIEQVMTVAARETDTPIGIRQPIWLDPQNVADGMAVARAVGIAFIVVAAPIPIGLLVDPDSGAALPRPEPGERSLALGRLSGAAVTPIALAELRLATRALEGSIPLIGSGGITDDAAARAFLLTGATAVELDLEGTDAARWDRVQTIADALSAHR